MSRQNKVNPGKYTQAGRLSQDDAAREMMRQRASIASRNQRNAGPPPWEVSQPSTPARDEVDEGAQEVETAGPAARAAAKPAPKKKAAKRKAASKTRAAKTAARSGATTRRPARKAALARNVTRKPAAAKTKAKSKRGSATRRSR